MSLKKTVDLPIEVPVGNYCYLENGKVHCEHFDGRGNSAMCGYHIGKPVLDNENWLKPKECNNLKETENDNSHEA